MIKTENILKEIVLFAKSVIKGFRSFSVINAYNTEFWQWWF